jgi:hypothetical protein
MDQRMPPIAPLEYAGTTSHLVEELYSILSAVWAGARYGLKIRLPHAAVMTVLFRRELDSRQKLRSIVKLAAEHASNLAAFAAIYKTILALLKWTSRTYHLQDRPPANEGFFRSLGRALLSMIGKRISEPRHEEVKE